ncbi:MAG: M20 family metallopeptidase [Thermotogota bacterium]
MEINEIKELLSKNIDNNKEKIFKVSEFLKENPEIGFEEYKANEFLTNELKSLGFNITKPTDKLPTSFIGKLPGKVKDKKIAILFEYDALPGIGHGCGHNMISAISYGACLGLSELNDLPGEIYAVGCPGEENGGGKVILANEGIFDEFDAAMMIHPATENKVYSTSLALDAIKFVFKGQTAHASSSPEKGINALDAVIHFFNGINYLRQYVKDGTRIHGIISKGGEAPNVIPDYAEAKFYFRAKSREYLNEVVDKAIKIAEGATKMTGASLEWDYYELSNDDLKPSKPLANVFRNNYEKLGINDIEPDTEGGGSTDVGNVSHRIPAVHPYIAIATKHSLTGHTIEFRDATVSKEGKKATLEAAKAIAFSVIDLLFNPSILKSIKEEYINNKEI